MKDKDNFEVKVSDIESAFINIEKKLDQIYDYIESKDGSIRKIIDKKVEALYSGIKELRERKHINIIDRIKPLLELGYNVSIKITKDDEYGTNIQKQAVNYPIYPIYPMRYPTTDNTESPETYPKISWASISALYKDFDGDEFIYPFGTPKKDKE